ncbi:MAG TPA: methylated-DNA--[protein]-cysteine S-methyltransferase [Burkholderiales bacterium]
MSRVKSDVIELLLGRVPAPKSAPFDALLYAMDGDQLCAAEFAGYEWRMEKSLLRHYGSQYRLVTRKDTHGVGERLTAYLGGAFDAVDDLPVSTAGTEFQRSAWLALRKIPVGQTASYAAQAARIGKPAAVRAVGAANGQNPIVIVLPCHRVIGTNGALTGFGGGIPTKAWLLRHEGALLA